MIEAILVLAIIGAILGTVLGVADKFLKVEVDPREDYVLSKLAGANCGGCGYPGCAGFAAAIINGEVVQLSKCAPTNKQVKEGLVEYLNTTPGPDGTTLKVKL